MKRINIAAVGFSVLAGLQVGFAQSPAPKSTPPPVASPTPSIAEIVSKNVAGTIGRTPVSRDRREQAYAKLLEAQRYIWKINRSRSQSGFANNARLAKESLQKAIELDPTLAEGYTTLAELVFPEQPKGLDEAIILAGIAVKLDPQNFGGHRLLARIYTIRSRRENGDLEPNFTQKAIAEWKEVARLDSRNAEAFAFLSEFYERTGKPAERVDALRKWLSAAAPLDSRFYRAVFGGRGDLSPESATLKFGQALLDTGEMREALEVLSRAVADNPENEEAVALLGQAVQSADESSAATAIQSLQQAVYANPENATLVEMLAQMQVRGGKISEAAKLLQDSTAKIKDKNRNAAAALQFALGEIYGKANRTDEAIAAYQNALTFRGVSDGEAITDDERDYAIRVFARMIDVYKKANRLNDVKSVIERSRAVLGKADTFADRRMISFYIETGKKAEALQAVRALRAKTPSDRELTELEARILTEDGKVDEAVALLKTPVSQGVGTGSGSGSSDGNFAVGNPISAEVRNFLYISELYALAKRPKEAVQSVNQALSAAKTKYEKEVVRLTLATMQQTNGDYNAAEGTLREILKETPSNSIALNNLGYFLAERGEKLDEALKLIQQALALDPGNPSYLDSLGWAYFKLGNLAEAEKNLKAALLIDNTSSTIQEHLGDVYQKQGKFDLAKSAWQKALTLTSEPDEVNRLKAKIK